MTNTFKVISNKACDERSSHLLNNIFVENWSEVRNILKQNEPLGTDFNIAKQRDSSGLSVLSVCLSLDAPIDILKKVHELDPTQVHQLDVYGATILHHACLNGSSFDTIASSGLIPNYLVSVEDVDGRLPIHILLVSFITGEVQIQLETVIDVIKWMVEIDPEILYRYDKCGDIPIDVVYNAVTEENVKEIKPLTSFLRAEGVKLWKTKKSAYEKAKRPHYDCKGSLAISECMDKDVLGTVATVLEFRNDSTENLREPEVADGSKGLVVRKLRKSSANGCKWKRLFVKFRQKRSVINMKDGDSDQTSMMI